MTGDERERRIPFDGDIPVRVDIVDHRVRQATLVLEPEVTLLHQLGNGVALEELGSGATRGRFRRDGFNAVLAELEGRGVIAIRPRAARTVEAVGLICGQQRPRAFHRNVVLQQRVLDAAQAPQPPAGPS